MQTVEIQKRQVTGRFQSFKTEIPQTWNECTREQAMMLYQIIMQQEGTPQEKRLEVMRELTTLSIRELELMRQDFQNEFKDLGDTFYFDQINTLCEQIADPFFDIQVDDETGEKHYSIRLELTKNPYPYLIYSAQKKERRRLYACEDRFENMTIYELGTVFTLFEQFLRQPENISLVDRLLAVIYREPKSATPENRQSGYNGDIRRPLMGEEGMVARRAAHFAGVPEIIKQIMLFWVGSCRESIVKEFPNIFGAEVAQAASEKNFGWGGILLSIANGPAMLDEVAKQPWGNVFVWLSMLEDQRKQQEFQNSMRNGAHH